MKAKILLLIVPLLLIAVLAVYPVSAGSLSANISGAVQLITNPCSSAGIQTSKSSPELVSCKSPVNDFKAFISVPVPYLVDQAPNLGLVSIPTFHRLTWDPNSLGYIDTAPITFAYPSGDPKDRLVNFRVELRLLPGKASPEGNDIVIENVVLNAIGPIIYHLEDPEIPDYVCSQGSNTLLAVPSGQGGLVKEGDHTCEGIKNLLGSYPKNIPSLGDDERYEGWQALEPPEFITFSPYASIKGKGTYEGSPAFQLAATTAFILEARVNWDVHQVKNIVNETVCSWSFWDDYDFIDEDNWPDPVFCRNEVRVEWETYCKPNAGGCSYGNPEGWWQPILEGSVDLLRRADGSYGPTYDFLSVQSQPLLTSP
jgi:hypothetical protein